MTGVYSFYKMNDITLPSLPRNESRPKPLKQHKEIPTKEDLQVVLSHADDIERAIVLIGVSSGLGAQEICNLTFADFKKGYDPETGVTTLKLRREKAEYDFVTFLSPEASNSVLNYLDSRNRQP
jgi:integrase